MLKEIEALTQLPRTDARDREIESLQRRLESVRADLYKSLTPWQRVLVARHPNRPSLEDFIQRLFTGFIEIHGDRRFADDHALMTGFADYKGQPVLLVGHVKGGDTKEKIFRNFGYARPEGYRKAMRAMRLAEKFSRPIVVFVDTPAAYPGHRVGGARRRRGDRRQPARHDGARHADHRHRQRRRRQRRRARHRGRRPGADAGVRDLQRHPARRVRGDSVARPGEEGRGGAGAEAHGARLAQGRHHRRDHAGADRRRAHRSAAAARAGRRGAAAGARRGERARPPSTAGAAVQKFRNMGRLGIDFVDEGES